jgi:hypothetical protein
MECQISKGYNCDDKFYENVDKFITCPYLQKLKNA